MTSTSRIVPPRGPRPAGGLRFSRHDERAGAHPAEEQPAIADGDHQPSTNHTAESSFVGRCSRPLIIGGSPRSGTTLVRTMLHSHPELAIPRETRFVIEAWDRRRLFGDLSDADNRRRLAGWIFERDESLHRRFGLNRKKAIERLVAAPPTLGSVLAECFVLYAEKHRKPRWGDKRPKYAARLAVVWDLFPSAHFVNVVRDPRACVASMRRLGWHDGSIAAAVEIWERSLATVNAWRDKLAADQLLDVRYEDLVTDQEATLTRIAEFGSLAADEDAVGRMLRYHERTEVHSERYHANLFRPPDRSRVFAWREALETPEIAFVEEATRPLMAQYGYELVADGVSVPGELRHDLARSRRRRAAAGLKIDLKDRLKKLVTYRRPVAALQAGGSDVAPGTTQRR